MTQSAVVQSNTEQAGMIRIEHLRKEYSNVTPLKDVNAVIEKGDVIAIIGPSGTGKSTLLRMLNQLEMPTSGKVCFDGECITDPSCDITKVRQKMGMVFQSFNLYESLCVVENIMVGPVKLKGLASQEAYDKAMNILERVGLADKALNFPDELSGGQKQRVAIARAIAMEPEMLLLDEPTSALDPKMVNEVQRVIAGLAESGMTMMIVTHEMSFAKSISNRIFYMDEGIVYEEGTPEQIFDHPQREKTREFVRRLNMLEMRMSTSEFKPEQLFEQLRGFSRNNILSRKAANKLTLLLEELIIGCVIEQLPIGEDITLRIEYDQASESADVQLEYSGEAFDVLAVNAAGEGDPDAGDGFSVAIVRSMAPECEHRYVDGINRITLRASLK